MNKLEQQKNYELKSDCKILTSIVLSTRGENAQLKKENKALEEKVCLLVSQRNRLIKELKELEEYLKNRLTKQ
tara:strand:+ start:78490 stop:78708 length:219 start_codon:yes stop_codon:yes gene_type:complete